MAVQSITLVVGDTAPPLRATLSNANGPQDLTGATVVARLRRSIDGDLVEVDMDVEDAEAGIITHTWDASETDEALSYKVEFVVTFADGTIETWPNLASNVPLVVVRQRKTLDAVP